MYLRFLKNKIQSDYNALQDNELLLKYKNDRDPDIIAILFQRYIHLVFGVCIKYLQDKDEAKDAVMEIFEGLFTDIIKHDIHHFKNWLYSVTRNHCLMKLRKDGCIRVNKETLADDINEKVVEIDDELHQDIDFLNPDHVELDEALRSLKESQRICIKLFYLENKTYKEVCEITGYSMNEVKSYIQNGRRNLKMKLENRHVKKPKHI